MAVQSDLMSPFSRISSNSEIFSLGMIMLALNFTIAGSSFPDFDLEAKHMTIRCKSYRNKTVIAEREQDTQTAVGDEVSCQHIRLTSRLLPDWS
jgi:hypothetical protein